MLRRKLMMAAFNSCTEKLPAEFGALEVIALDPRGRVIADATASLFRERESFPLHKAGYGQYRLEVQAPLWYAPPRQITIAQPRATIRVAMQWGMACTDPHRPILGLVSGMRRNEELWVKAVPVAGAAAGEEVRVDAGGTFVLPGLPGGEYLVLVLRGNTVAATALARTFTDEPPLRITL